MRVEQILCLRSLAAAGECGAARVGHKAHALGLLTREGFPVPDGLVLAGGPSGDAAAEHMGPQPTIGRVAATDLGATALEMAARRIVQHFGDVPLAVRRSPAGGPVPPEQHARHGRMVVRPVRGAGALADAIRRAWASPGDDVERFGAGRPDRGALVPILVQRFVAAECAGSAWTGIIAGALAPEVLVSAWAGLAPPSGEGEADRWSIRDGLATPHSVAQQVLTRHQVQAVADLVTRARVVTGAHQHVDWAMAEQRLWVLRYRPAFLRG